MALSFTPDMEGAFDRVEQAVSVALAFRELDDMEGVRRFFAFWVVEGDALSFGRRVDDCPNSSAGWIGA